MAKLSVSRLVNVQILLAAAAAQGQNLSTLLALSSTAPIDTVERLRSYTSLAAVAADVGTTDPIYRVAQLWFAQVPQPADFKAGRWAKTATNGLLVGGTLSAANQAIAGWQAIAAGSFKIGIDAVAALDVTGMNFTGAANLNAVAAIIQTAVRAANAAAGFTAAVVLWDANFQRFTIQSGTTGAASKVLFLAPAATGTDISAKLSMQASSGGAYRADGLAPETAVQAAALFDAQFGQSFYALTIPEADEDDHVEVGSFIEGTNNKHTYWITTQDAGTLVPTDTTDLASQLKALGLKKTAIQYSLENAYAASSMAGRILTTQWGGNNTTIDLFYKNEPLVVAESINETQAQSLAGKNCNVFAAYDNDTAIIQNGDMCSGDPIDLIVGCDAFAIDVQNEVYNLLYTSPTKIPQTDAGNQLIATVIESVCSKYVANGFLAPGVWDQTGFGTLKQGDFLAKGFYVYAPPIASQAKADRQARKSVVFQVAAKTAGAIRTVDIVLNVAR